MKRLEYTNWKTVLDNFDANNQSVIDEIDNIVTYLRKSLKKRVSSIDVNVDKEPYISYAEYSGNYSKWKSLLNDINDDASAEMEDQSYESLKNAYQDIEQIIGEDSKWTNHGTYELLLMQCTLFALKELNIPTDSNYYQKYPYGIFQQIFRLFELWTFPLWINDNSKAFVINTKYIWNETDIFDFFEYYQLGEITKILAYQGEWSETYFKSIYPDNSKLSSYSIRWLASNNIDYLSRNWIVDIVKLKSIESIWDYIEEIFESKQLRTLSISNWYVRCSWHRPVTKWFPNKREILISWGWYSIDDAYNSMVGQIERKSKELLMEYEEYLAKQRDIEIQERIDKSVREALKEQERAEYERRNPPPTQAELYKYEQERKAHNEWLERREAMLPLNHFEG